MLAHLFDHDNLYINKLEAIIDRFSEICEISAPQDAQVRDRLINITSMDMLVKLAQRLPTDQQGLLKEIQDSPSTEVIDKFKSNFSSEDLVKQFHISAIEIMKGKLELIKTKLAPSKQLEVEDLIQMIGKY